MEEYKVTVTKSMRKAGLKVVREWKVGDGLRGLVGAIYRAMEAARMDAQEGPPMLTFMLVHDEPQGDDD